MSMHSGPTENVLEKKRRKKNPKQALKEKQILARVVFGPLIFFFCFNYSLTAQTLTSHFNNIPFLCPATS